MSKISRAQNIDDLQQLARARLPKFLFDNIISGAGDETTPAHNRDAFLNWRLATRILPTRPQSSQQVVLFGQRYNSPFGISSTGQGQMLRPKFEEYLAEVAAEANIPYILSCVAGASIERIAKIAPNNVWFQIYGAEDRSITRDLVKRARDAGVRNLVMTADWPIKSDSFARNGIAIPMNYFSSAMPRLLLQLIARPRWLIDYFRNGGLPMLENYAPYSGSRKNALAATRTFQAQFPSKQTWSDFEAVRKEWPGNLVLKGLLHPDDATRASELGVDGVTVSNHGGRISDRSISSIDALPGIVAALDGKIPVFLDSGIRRGSDIVVAKCLGAAFTFVGRATMFGVIAGGKEGASRAVEILRKEVNYTLSTLGNLDFNQLTPNVITH